MKRDKVVWLIDVLRHVVDDNHFHMAKWLCRAEDRMAVIYRCEADIPHCRTAGCIAGTVFLKLTPEQRADYKNKAWSDPEGGTATFRAGKDELGMTSEEAFRLFEPIEVTELGLITRQEAIAVLENILVNETIHWATVIPRDRINVRLQPLKVTLE